MKILKPVQILISDQKRLRVSFWFLAIVLAMIQGWARRFHMNPDGIFYLDIGDAYFQDNWRIAIDGYWSPLYSWILGFTLKLVDPAPQWEAVVVHSINLIIFVAALTAFDFFWHQAKYEQQTKKTVEFTRERIIWPEWTWLTLGYTIFIWSHLTLINVWEVTPDMIVAVLALLAAGLLLRLRRGAANWKLFAILGSILGLAYLTKAAMFPIAFLFLGVSSFIVKNVRRMLPRVLVAVLFFLLFSAPFMVLLFQAKGRLTFGDTGVINYVWYVNGVPGVHWQGQDPSNGQTQHPTRKIAEMPAIYEYASPVGGSFPPGYDPSYWYEGIRIHFSPSKQIAALISNLAFYYDLFFRRQASLVVGILLLLFMSRNIKAVVTQWPLLLLGICPLAMYALVHIETRFIGAFIVILWAGLLRSLRTSISPQARQLIGPVTLVIVMLLMIDVFAYTTVIAKKSGPALTQWHDASAHEHWQVAAGLHLMGVERGDQVAFIGNPFGAYWARLAGVKIMADIFSPDDVSFFWASPSVKQSKVMKTLATTGAILVITKGIPTQAQANGWHRIRQTDYYLSWLPSSKNKSSYEGRTR